MESTIGFRVWGLKEWQRKWKLLVGYIYIYGERGYEDPFVYS